jgi:hypothetical protein
LRPGTTKRNVLLLLVYLLLLLVVVGFALQRLGVVAPA